MHGIKGMILVSGYGGGELTLEACAALENAQNIILHTENCALSVWLKSQGLAYTALDGMYETAPDFDAHTAAVVELLESYDSFVFCVMDTSDESAKALIKKHPELTVCGGGTLAALELRSSESLVSVSACALKPTRLSPLSSTLIRELSDRLLAGEVKLALQSVYGDDARAFMRLPEGRVIELDLEDMDRLKRYDHTCACLVNPRKHPQMYDFECLRLISGANAVNHVLSEPETIAKRLADVVQCIQAGEDHGEFSQAEVFELAADILSKGELP